MSDTLCICGCTLAQHQVEHEESHYPDSRTVETWRACKAHNCILFRPVLAWPDAEGWWWCKHNEEVPEVEIVNAWKAMGGEVCLYSEFWGDTFGEKYRFRKPAYFVKVLEPNPFN